MFNYYQPKFMEYYHKRSNIESCFSMLKRKFGNHVYSKTEVGQNTEILCKALVHNLCVLIQETHELGIDADFCAENPNAQKIKVYD